MSGIYIKDFEIPKHNNPYDVPDVYGISGKILIRKDGKAEMEVQFRNELRHFDLISVPDHGRLIDADALEEKTDDRYSFGEIGRRQRDDIVGALQYCAPTIIPASKETGE